MELVIVRTSIVCFVPEWSSAILLLRSLFLVTRLCSVSGVFKFPVGFTNVSGLEITACDLRPLLVLGVVFVVDIS